MKVEQKPSSPPTTTSNSSNLLDFAFDETPQIVPVNDFQTNAFQTKGANVNGGFDDFLQSFKQN